MYDSGIVPAKEGVRQAYESEGSTLFLRTSSGEVKLTFRSWDSSLILFADSLMLGSTNFFLAAIGFVFRLGFV